MADNENRNVKAGLAPRRLGRPGDIGGVVAHLPALVLPAAQRPGRR